MSFRNQTQICGLLIGSTLAIVSACGGLDNVKVVIVDAGGSGNSSGNGAGGAKPSGGESNGEAGAAGSAGAAGEEASGGEGGETGLPDALTIVSVSPTDGATAIDPQGPIRITFSEPLNEDTVTFDNVQLQDESGTPITGLVTYADSVVTIRPAGRLNLLGQYSVNVNTEVTSAANTALAEPFASSFTVRDGNWGKAEAPLTASTAAFANYPESMATDHAGRAVAVWAQYADMGSAYDIYAAFFNQGKGWATPVKVNTNAVGCQYPNVAMNTSGNIIVGWIEYDPAVTPQSYSLQTRRNIAGTWDATSTRVDIASASTIPLTIDNVVVALTANNHAHAVWNAHDNNSTVTPPVSDFGVFARHADAAGRWDTAVASLTPLQVGSAVSAPSIAFDAAGNGFAAYQFTNNASPVKTSTIVQRYLVSNNKWGVSALASTASDGSSSRVAVAANPDGEAVLGYLRVTIVDANNTTYEVLGSYFNKAWSAPLVISNTTTSISTSMPASATWTGNSFLMAWAQSGGSLTNIYANQYKTAWGTATIISDGNHSAALPWLTSDGRGNALAVWSQLSETGPTGSTQPYDIVSARFLGATEKWGDPVHASGATAAYRYPQTVTLADGTIVAAWQRIINNVNLTKAFAVTGVLGNDFN